MAPIIQLLPPPAAGGLNAPYITQVHHDYSGGAGSKTFEPPGGGTWSIAADEMLLAFIVRSGTLYGDENIPGFVARTQPGVYFFPNQSNLYIGGYTPQAAGCGVVVVRVKSSDGSEPQIADGCAGHVSTDYYSGVLSTTTNTVPVNRIVCYVAESNESTGPHTTFTQPGNTLYGSGWPDQWHEYAVWERQMAANATPVTTNPALMDSNEGFLYTHWDVRVRNGV